MGGNVFKDGSTRRVTAKEFGEICQQFTSEFKKLQPYLHFEILPAYANKPDFGNLSIFVRSDGLETNKSVLKMLRNTLATGQTVVTDNRVTIAYRGIQVDVTLVPAENYQFSLSYHSYNGMGAMLGRIATSMGLTLRDSGMVYKLQDGDQAVAEIGVARSWQQALMILGYSFSRWCKGFSTTDEMFEFIASSEFFQTELWSKVDPAMPGERPTINQMFAQYLQSVPALKLSLPLTPLELLYDRIPGFCTSYDTIYGQWLAHKAEQKVIHAKFNGNLVTAWTGLTGRELGKLMQYINETFGTRETLGRWVLTATAEDIQTMVQAQHQRAKQSA